MKILVKADKYFCRYLDIGINNLVFSEPEYDRFSRCRNPDAPNFIAFVAIWRLVESCKPPANLGHTLLQVVANAPWPIQLDAFFEWVILSQSSHWRRNKHHESKQCRRFGVVH